MANNIDGSGSIKLRGADDTDSIGYFAASAGGTNMSLKTRSDADHQSNCMPSNNSGAPYKMSEYYSAHKIYGMSLSYVTAFHRSSSEGGGFQYGRVDVTVTNYAADTSAAPYYFARSVYHGNSQQSAGWVSNGTTLTKIYSDLHNSSGNKTWYFYFKDNRGCGAGDGTGSGGPSYGTLATAEVVDASQVVADAYSDKRLKKDITYIGKSDKGYNIYSFTYKTNPKRKFSGVMGDEIQKILPEAISIDENGYLKVKYSMLDVELAEIS
jgi:hypothetical protein